MDLGLSMAVKDEEAVIRDCLREVCDLFSCLVVVDTGSSDRTLNILSAEFGIEAKRYPVPADGLMEAKNLALSSNSAPWVLCLDADEVITRGDVQRLRSLQETKGVDGYFMPWINQRGESRYDDYKLFLCRSHAGIGFLDPVHSNLQISIRDKGSSADWVEGVSVLHQRNANHDLRRKLMPPLIEQHLAREPGWFRGHWFLGYHRFIEGDEADAQRHFSVAAASRSSRFPVECLNAHMLLVHLYAQRQEGPLCEKMLESAMAFYASVEGDFEVRVNFRLRDWLLNARQQLDRGQLNLIQAYQFAC